MPAFNAASLFANLRYNPCSKLDCARWRLLQASQGPLSLALLTKPPSFEETLRNIHRGQITSTRDAVSWISRTLAVTRLYYAPGRDERERRLFVIARKFGDNRLNAYTSRDRFLVSRLSRRSEIVAVLLTRKPHFRSEA